MTLRILGVETATPPHRYSTEELLEKFPSRLSDEVVHNVLNLGVRSRFLAFSLGREFTRRDGVTVSSLCKAAAETLFESTGTSPARVGLMIATSDYSDLLSPGLSDVVLRGVGLGPGVPTFNLQGMACSAVPRCFQLARAWLRDRPTDSILVLVSGMNSGWFVKRIRKTSRVLSPAEIRARDRSRAWKERELQKWIATVQAFLFGDGVSALLLADGPGPIEVERIGHVTNLDPDDWKGGYIGLSGSDRLELVSSMSKEIDVMGERYVHSVIERVLPDGFGDISHWLLHTGSRRILDRLVSSLGIAEQQVEESYAVLADYGNLGGASLPFILKEVVDRSRGGRGCMVGFGWGFSASGCSIRL